MKKALIVGNGKPPLKSFITKLKSFGYDFIIAADGGYNSLVKLNLQPNVVIGDFDSIIFNKEKKNASTKFIKLSRQNDTDMEKAVKFAVKNKFEKIILLAATGMRIDHTLGNLAIPLKYAGEIEIAILSNYSFLQIIHGRTSFASQKGETISFIAFDKNVTFTSHGLKYEMNNLNLSFGYKESISNESRGQKFEIKVEGGFAMMIRNAKFVLKHAFI